MTARALLGACSKEQERCQRRKQSGRKRLGEERKRHKHQAFKLRQRDACSGSCFSSLLPYSLLAIWLLAVCLWGPRAAPAQSVAPALRPLKVYVPYTHDSARAKGENPAGFQHLPVGSSRPSQHASGGLGLTLGYTGLLHSLEKVTPASCRGDASLPSLQISLLPDLVAHFGRTFAP